MTFIVMAQDVASDYKYSAVVIVTLSWLELSPPPPVLPMFGLGPTPNVNNAATLHALNRATAIPAYCGRWIRQPPAISSGSQR